MVGPTRELQLNESRAGYGWLAWRQDEDSCSFIGRANGEICAGALVFLQLSGGWYHCGYDTGSKLQRTGKNRA